MALGAGRGIVTRMVVRQGMTMAVVGALVGAAGAFLGARLLRSMLFEVGTTDPLTWIATPTFLLATVLLSSWLPARRAARTDAAVVLRD